MTGVSTQAVVPMVFDVEEDRGTVCTGISVYRSSRGGAEAKPGSVLARPALFDRQKQARVGLHLARENSGGLGGLGLGQAVQPLGGSDGTGGNVVGNAAKDAIGGRSCGLGCRCCT